MCNQVGFEEFIKVNNRFQKSIHLRLDRTDKEKVSAYIPTRASVQVLKEYFGITRLQCAEQTTTGISTNLG